MTGHETEARRLAREFQIAAMSTAMGSVERIRAETAIAIVGIAKIEATTMPREQADAALAELDRVLDVVELDVADER